jgi:PAS domain-containing protein
MSLICSICRNTMGASTGGALEGNQFCLCDDCRREFESRNSTHNFSGVLERYSEPVLVVDATGRLLACNRLAEGAVGRPIASLLGLQPGEVLECKHASEAAGCGKTEHCGACALRLALNYTVKNGRGCEHMPATLECTHKGKPAVRRFTLSTQKVGDMVRVLLEDDGFLPSY